MDPKIIFDLSEVLISGLVGIEKPLSAILDLPGNGILACFAGQPLEDICCGKISEDAYLEQIIRRQKWDISVGSLKDCIRANFHRQIQGTRMILRRLSQNYDVVLLSDHAREWVSHIQAIHPFIGEYNQVFFSYELGKTKKNPETFHEVLVNISCQAEECWLIDESAKNIATAATWRTICKLAFFKIGHLSFLFPTPLFDEPDPSFRVGFVILIALMLIYFSVTFITPRHQSLHDLIAKTLVVRR